MESHVRTVGLYRCEVSRYNSHLPQPMKNMISFFFLSTSLRSLEGVHSEGVAGLEDAVTQVPYSNVQSSQSDPVYNRSRVVLFLSPFLDSWSPTSYSLLTNHDGVWQSQLHIRINRCSALKLLWCSCIHDSMTMKILQVLPQQPLCLTKCPESTSTRHVTGKQSPAGRII